MVRVSNSFHFLPLEVGVSLIGCTHIIGFSIGIYLGNPIQVLLELLCMLTFFRMKSHENNENRQAYFATYIVYTALLGLLRFISVVTNWDFSEKALVRNYCTNLYQSLLKDGNDWSATSFKGKLDCRNQIGSDMIKY